MEALLFSGFNKRRRSTKRPDIASGSPVTFTMKSNTSVVNPAFQFRGSLSEGVNYVYIPQMAGYYFVDDVVSVANYMYELQCSLDVLATLKNEIVNSSQYVLYDTTANSEIIDQRLSQKTTASVRASAGVSFPSFSKNGYVALSVNGAGTVGYYAFKNDDAGLKNLTAGFEDWLVSQRTGTDMRDIVVMFEQFCNSGSIAENIKTAYWIPMDFHGSVSNIEEVVLGNFHTGYTGVRIPDGDKVVIEPYATVSIPWQFNDWRNGSSNTNVYLYLPFVGLLNYNASELKGQNTIKVEVSRDQVIGDLAIKVSAGNIVLGTYGASVGVPFPIGSSNISGKQIISSIAQGLSGVAMAATGGALGVAAGVTQSLIGSMSLSAPINTVVGGIGSAAGVGLDMDIVCFTVCHDTVVNPTSVTDIMGTPTMAYKSLSNLTGYVQTSGATLPCAWYGGVKEEVESLLNGGVYIE